MRFKQMFIAFFAFALFLTSNATLANAQNKCGLFISIVEKSNKENEKPKQVTDATVKIVSEKTAKAVNVKFDEETQWFLATNLRNGNYRITVSKNNFKRSVQNLNFPCEGTGGLMTTVEMEKGNSQKIISSKATAGPILVRGV